MSLHLFGLTMAYIGSACGVAMVVPQLLRTLREPSVGGVSPTSWALTTVACFSWLLYGVRADEFPQIPGNLLLVSGAIAVTVLVPARVPGAVRALLLAAAMGTMVAVAWTVPPDAVGYIGFGLGLVAALPQTVESVVRAGSRGPSAVSISSWALRAASQACWLTFAVIDHAVPVMVAATVTLASALLLVVAEARHQSRARAAALAADTHPALAAA